MIYTIFGGFCMALADSVPGGSGGTIAFILGFYDNFIGSLHTLFHGNLAEKKTAIMFLLKIGAGWIVGFLMAVSLLADLFTTGIYEISSLFLGFVIAAIPLVISEEKDAIKGKYSCLVFSVIGGPGAADAYELFFYGVGSGAFPIHSDLYDHSRCAGHFCHGASGDFGIDAADELRIIRSGTGNHQTDDERRFSQRMADPASSGWCYSGSVPFAGRHQENAGTASQCSDVCDPGDDGGFSLCYRHGTDDTGRSKACHERGNIPCRMVYCRLRSRTGHQPV